MFCDEDFRAFNIIVRNSPKKFENFTSNLSISKWPKYYNSSLNQKVVRQFISFSCLVMQHAPNTTTIYPIKLAQISNVTMYEGEQKGSSTMIIYQTMFPYFL
jgi:hypothetical protein